MDGNAPGLSSPLDFALPVTQNEKKRKEAEAAYSSIIEFISINHVNSQSLKIPKLPPPSFDLATSANDTVKKYDKIKDIQNGDIFDPINSKFYHAEVAQARKLTGKEAAKTCWEVTLRIDGELDRKTDFYLRYSLIIFYQEQKLLTTDNQ